MHKSKKALPEGNASFCFFKTGYLLLNKVTALILIYRRSALLTALAGHCCAAANEHSTECIEYNCRNHTGLRKLVSLNESDPALSERILVLLRDNTVQMLEILHNYFVVKAYALTENLVTYEHCQTVAAGKEHVVMGRK